MGSVARSAHRSRSRWRVGGDLAAIAGLVAVGYVVVLALVEREWMDVAPAFAILTLPAVVFLAWRPPMPMPWARVLVGTAVFGGMFGLFFEMFQESGDSYRVVAASFPKLLGVVPVDSVLAHMAMTLLTLTFYERFVLGTPSVLCTGSPPMEGHPAHRTMRGAARSDSTAPADLSPRARYGIGLGSTMVVAVVVAHMIEPGWVDIGYSYAVLGTAAIAPPVVLALKRPAWLRNLTLVVPVFLAYYLVMEVVAVRHGWWVYPADHYLGWVTLPVPGGDIRFPFEELFFWMTLYAAALTSYYEIFLLPAAGNAPATPPHRQAFAVRGVPGEGATERDHRGVSQPLTGR